MWGAGCGVQGVECRVWGAGCGVQGVGCRVWGAGCGVQGVGCRVWGVRAVADLVHLAHEELLRVHHNLFFMRESMRVRESV